MEQILTEAAGARRHGHGGRGRQRLDRRGQRRPAARRLPGLGAPRAGLRRDRRCRRRGPRSQSETVWNDPRRRRRPAAASAASSPCPATRPTPSLPVNVDTQAAGRGVPDVCGNADPQTGYVIRVDGAEQIDRRHERGRAAVGGADRAPRRAARRAARVRAAAAVPAAGQRLVPRHHLGQQRRPTRPAPAGTPAPGWAPPTARRWRRRCRRRRTVATAAAAVVEALRRLALVA